MCRAVWESDDPERHFDTRGTDRIIEGYYASALKTLPASQQRAAIGDGAHRSDQFSPRGVLEQGAERDGE